MIDWAELRSFLTRDTFIYLIDQYRSLGPIPGILITFLESFLPPLPLFLLVAANVTAYGFGFGFLYSWIGVVGGACAIFLIFSKLGEYSLPDKWKKGPLIPRSPEWVQRHAFSTIFLISCLPFGPSALFNIIAGLSGMSFRSFLVAVSIGKAIMICLVSFIGHDLPAFIHSPLKIMIVATIAASLWFASKLIEARVTK